MLGAAPMATDERGIPTLLRFTDAPLMTGANPTEIAIAHVERMLPAWGVQKAPDLVGIGEVPTAGGTIVRLEQRIDDLPIADREVHVFVKPDGGLHAISGAVYSADIQRTSATFATDEQHATAAAISEELKVAIEPAKLKLAAKKNGLTLVSGASNGVTVSQAGTRRVWFAMNNALVAAWSTDAFAGRDSDVDSLAFHVTRAASDGRVLQRNTLTADAAYQYRVWASANGEKHPYDSPLVDYVPNTTGVNTPYPTLTNPTLVSVDSLNNQNDPWLPANATTTSGNNVVAYTDANPPDGFSAGDFYANTTGTGVFDRIYDFTQSGIASDDQQKSGITAMFYTTNWLHDFWYDHGFTETAGNAQLSNYGRGGAEGDPLVAQAQDNAKATPASLNNANMSTPADGISPRLQIYLWTGKPDVTLTAGARVPQANVAAFGPTTFDVTGELVLANDGSGTVTDACQALTGVTGKIVLVDRGTCSFKTKALNAQQAGAVGIIVANNAVSATPPSLGDDTSITTAITIGVLSVTKDDGTTLKGDLAGGTVNTTEHRGTGGPLLDGDLDASVIAHEYGHYLHHRLSDCSLKLCSGMSEGWGDFDSLLFSLSDGDNLDAAYPMGVFSTPSFTTAPAYFGIRRMPYSTQTTINSLSFRMIAADADGGALATTAPLVDLGDHTEVHNAGEVWAETMFEAYVALQKTAANWATGRSRMADYTVAGLLLAPVDTTPTEQRDALIVAAAATSSDDAATIATAFAKRGMGTCAVSPARDSQDNKGIVESTVTAGKLIAGTPQFASTSCDNDGVIDDGETGSITIPIANSGGGPLQNVTVLVTTTTPGVTLTDASTTIATVAPGATVMATAKVSLDDSATGPIEASFTATLMADNQCEAAAVTVTAPIRMNTDDVPNSSATDTFDTAATVWTQPTGFQGWEHVRPTALDGKFHGPDTDGPLDLRLESPALTAAATGNVTLKFTHSYDFEAGYDGGVIEYTVDDGATWNDITMLGVTPGYATGAITNCCGSPLVGREVYSDKNPSFPATDDVTLDFGEQLAGQTFKIRFRVGADAATGGDGWLIDNVAFTGIVGTPFPSQVADNTVCTTNPMDPDAGMTAGSGSGSGSGQIGDGTNDDGCWGCATSTPRPTSVMLALGVMGLVLRRRRRAA